MQTRKKDRDRSAQSDFRPQASPPTRPYHRTSGRYRLYHLLSPVAVLWCSAVMLTVNASTPATKHDEYQSCNMTHCFVSVPGRMLLLVQIMNFFPRKSEKEKRGNTRWLDTQLGRQVRTQICHPGRLLNGMSCSWEVTYALWDS